MSAQFASSTRPVVVGVDGSTTALDAVRWAAAEAGRRKVALRLVVAVPLATHHVAMPVLRDQLRDELVTRARRDLARAAAVAGERSPKVAVSVEYLTGHPTPVLVEESREAQLIVVGSRGLGGLAGLLVGSVAVGVSAQADCPVVVVREVGRSGPVVVGVDGTPNSEAAVAFAFEAAAVRGAQLVAAHTWADVDFVPPPPATSTDWQSIGDEEVVLAERLAGWGEKYPDVVVRRVVGHDRAARMLVELSRDAELVVVGSRGRGTVTGLALGSVSHAVLHGSRCPVAVVRPETATTTGPR